MPNRRKKELESSIERKCVDHAKKQGWKSMKLIGMFDMGWPDRMFIQPHRVRANFPIFFVEFKRPGAELTGKQEQVIADLKLRGCSVYKIDNVEAFKRLLSVATR